MDNHTWLGLFIFNMKNFISYLHKNFEENDYQLFSEEKSSAQSG
jgi:hypothetical protein